MKPAYLIFRNGKVITLDPMNSPAEALAIKGGQSLATDTNEEIFRYIGERTEVKDLEGWAIDPWAHLDPRSLPPVWFPPR